MKKFGQFKIILWMVGFVAICLIGLLIFYQPEKKTTVVCLGDSLTYGSGVGKHRDTDSYPAQLQNLLGDGYVVENYGLRNATASMESDLPYVDSTEYKKGHKRRADIVIVMLGANDSKTYNWNPEKYQAGLAYIVGECKKANPEATIILVRPPYNYSLDGTSVAEYEIQPGVVADELPLYVKLVADELQVPVIDMFAVTEGLDQLYTDGIHFNREGYNLIANTIYNELRNLNLL